LSALGQGSLIKGDSLNRSREATRRCLRCDLTAWARFSLTVPPGPFREFLNARRAFRIVSLGDADVFGEGLLPTEKFTFLVQQALLPTHLQTLLSAAEKKLLTAGAHYVAHTVADSEAVLDSIQARLKNANFRMRHHPGAIRP
jgi:hypothetical protein